MTFRVQLNYNQRPAGRPVEVIGLESAGKRKRVETGIQ